MSFKDSEQENDMIGALPWGSDGTVLGETGWNSNESGDGLALQLLSKDENSGDENCIVDPPSLNRRGKQDSKQLQATSKFQGIVTWHH